MTATFHVSALPPTTLDRIRSRGVDDFGNPVIVNVKEKEGGTPLRCCLRDATVGERFALIAYRPSSIGGAYAEVGPVFVHADRCDGYDRPHALPTGFRHRRQLLRSYDAQGRQVDNRIVEGRDTEGAIGELFARPEVAFVHSRSPLAGCYLFAIGRPSSAS